MNIKELKLKDKINLIDNLNIHNCDIKTVNLLRDILKDSDENEYLKIKSLKLLTQLAIKKNIKIRVLLTSFIDEWILSDNCILESKRLRYLSYFYEESPEEIEQIIKISINSNFSEVVSEAYYCLGRINLKYYLNDLEKLSVENMVKCRDLFEKSMQVLENRLDSSFFFHLVNIIIKLISDDIIHDKNIFMLEEKIHEFISNKLYFEKNNQFIPYYKCIINMLDIKKQSVDLWIDFRSSFYQIYEITKDFEEQLIINDLEDKSLHIKFKAFIKNREIEPFLSMQFVKEKTRVKRVQNMIDPNIDKDFYVFLDYLIELIDNKTIYNIEFIRNAKSNVQKLFPHVNGSLIEKLIIENKDYNPDEIIINVVSILSNKSFDNLLDSIVRSCLFLQGTKSYRGNVDEDERNKFIMHNLISSGFDALDQTQWSRSSKGLAVGEIDILILGSTKMPFCIIEGLNLECLNKADIKTHINKLFLYDTSGLEQNIILHYSESKNFLTLWNKYKNYIEGFNFKYQLKDLELIDDYPFSDIKIIKTSHIRNGVIVYLFHIFINMNNIK